MDNQFRWISKWSRIRGVGARRYILRRGRYLFLVAFLPASIIEFRYWHDIPESALGKWSSIWVPLSTAIFIAAIVALPLAVLFWITGEWRYGRHLSKAGSNPIA
jgi:hypothetical protein